MSLVQEGPAALRAAQSSRRRSRSIRRVAVGAVFSAVVVLVTLAPAYWMLVTSLVPLKQLFDKPPLWWPDLANIETYSNALFRTHLPLWFANTAIVAGGVTILALFLAVLAGYALSRFRFAGRGLMGFMLIVTQMLPEAMVAVPFYSLFLALGLINQLAGLIFADTAFVMPVAAWIMKGAFDAVPQEIDEAARIDGCTSLGVLRSVLLPLVWPSIAASAIIAFFYGWNEYLFAVTFISNENSWTASVGVASYIGQFLTPVDTVFAVSTLYAIVPTCFYLVAQRGIVVGLTAGAVKG